MNIDWKCLSASPGYKSLKAAYIRDVKEKKSFHTKEQLYKKFHWVINRAKHVAHATDTPIDVVLNTWEEKRDHWWISYYQECRQPKRHSASLMPTGINGMRKNLKSCRYYDKQRVKHAICNEIIRIQETQSKKEKKRWTARRKKKQHRC